ncbi:TetR/AcrR family transcriptional regulator [bacterium]|nr:hypothetical protein [Gemmatimonadota bacterium]MCH2664665.1 TetR/AcrR family transcriptional regulator [bacterium]
MTRKRLANAERRSQIIQVAMNLFASRGFKGTTTRAIAEAAGVSEAIIFRHFSTKEDLYNAIITTVLEHRNRIWEHDNIEGIEDLPDLMTRFGRIFIERSRKDQTFVRLMLYSALQDHKFRQRFFESNRNPYLRGIRERIERGVDSGEFAPADPQLTTQSFFWSLLQYVVNRFVASAEIPPEKADGAYITNLVAVYTRSLVPACKVDSELTT